MGSGVLIRSRIKAVTGSKRATSPIRCEPCFDRQSADGSWDESLGEGATRQGIITGTGFPKVFYLAYTLYREYFPLMALTTYRRAMEKASL